MPQSYNNKYFFITYLLLGLVLFIGNNQSRIKKANLLSKTIFYPLIYTVNEYKTFNLLKIENLEQKKTIGELIIKKNELETRLLKHQNSRIDFPVADTNYVLADVIGYAGNFFGRTIVVGKGQIHGVEVENPVFSTRGIVGKVIASYLNYSIILPINHPTFRLAVANKNSGVQGILLADIYGNIAMSYMRFGSNIAIGDTVVTSNLSYVFPANYPVGSITRLEESADALYLKAIIQPFNDVRNLQNVYVLLKTQIDLGNIEEHEDTEY